MQQCSHPRGGYNERFRFEEVVQEDIILNDDYNNSSGGTQMKPSAYWSSQPKHGYDNHYGHVNGLHKDGYRAQFSEDCYNNEGYNDAWNERYGHGNEHGAYKYQSGIPHDAIKYAGYGGQHQHQHQNQYQYQHQHHAGERPFWSSKSIVD